MKKICILFFIMALALTACSSSKPSERVTTAEYEKISIDDLSEEQLKYLTEEAGYTLDSISNMSYEGVNWHLLGTGLELYNPSSGVEKYGIVYTADSAYDYISDSQSEKKITMDEVYTIRAKEKNIRVEDMQAYEYTVEKNSSGYFKLLAPIEGYDETYLLMTYRINDDGTIKMLVPHLVCGEEEYIFSIYYDQAYFKAFYENGDYSYEGKVFYGIQYSSVTNKSLVLQLYNYMDKGYSYKGDLVIYNADNEECMRVDADYSVKLMTASIFPVEFTKELEAGKYTITIGEEYTLEFEVK